MAYLILLAIQLQDLGAILKSPQNKIN